MSIGSEIAAAEEMNMFNYRDCDFSTEDDLSDINAWRVKKTTYYCTFIVICSPLCYPCQMKDGEGNDNTIYSGCNENLSK